MNYTQIPQQFLVSQLWYVGRGRNANVGFYDGHYFQTIGIKFNHPDIKSEPYYTATTGCFQPFTTILELKGRGQIEKFTTPKQDEWYYDAAADQAILYHNNQYWSIQRSEVAPHIAIAQPTIIPQGTIIEPFGKHGWDAHYGRVLRI